MKRRYLMTGVLLGLSALGHQPFQGLDRPALDRSRTARFYTDDPGGGGGGGGTPPPGGGGGGTPPGGGGAAPTLEQLQAQLADLTGKFSATQKERDDAAAELKKIKDAQLTEAEKLKQDKEEASTKAAQAEEKLKATNVLLQIEREARKLNIRDEEAAFKLLDANAIQYDKDGKPTNIATLLEALIKAKPYLVGDDEGAGGGGSSNPGRPRGGGLTREDLRKMTPAQIAKLPQADVQAALAA